MSKQKQLSPKYEIFGKDKPENVRSIEEIMKDKKQKQLEHKQKKLSAKKKANKVFKLDKLGLERLLIVLKRIDVLSLNISTR